MRHTSRVASMNSSVVMVLSEGRPSDCRCAAVRARSKRPLLAMTTLSVMSQHGVGGPPEGSPRHRSGGPLGLLPDDLATQQQAKLVLEDPDHVGGKAAVRLAAQVRHVHSDPSPRLQDPYAFGEHVAEHLEVLEVRGGHAVAFHLQLVVLAHEVRRRGDDQGHRGVRQLVHVPGVAVQAPVAQVRRLDHDVVV